MNAYLAPLAIIAFLVLLNGLFVAAEFAIVVAPYTLIAQRAEAGSATARRVLRWLKSPAERNRYIATAQVGITIASLGLGMYGEHTLAVWLEQPLQRWQLLAPATAHTLAVILAVAILTYLHVVVGEMVPKSLAIQYATQSALRLARPMTLLEKLFAPIVLVLNGMGDFITRLMGVPPADSHERLFSSQELEFIVEESFAGGLLDPAEQLYLENIFDLQERDVSQVMTARNRIQGIPITASPAEVLEVLCTARHSRYPVYERDMDSIAGILHIKSVARDLVAGDGQTFDLQALMTPPLFVPETVTLKSMLVLFRQQRSHMAIVVDEYGGTAGIVTVEDLVEEVLGEIQDEFDQEQPPMRELTPGVLELRGDLLLDELHQHYGLSLQSAYEVDTVGGLIMAVLGRVPVVGDEVEVAGVQLRVQTLDGHAVGAALLYLPDAGETGVEGF